MFCGLACFANAVFIMGGFVVMCQHVTKSIHSLTAGVLVVITVVTYEPCYVSPNGHA